MCVLFYAVVAGSICILVHVMYVHTLYKLLLSLLSLAVYILIHVLRIQLVCLSLAAVYSVYTCTCTCIISP